MFADLRMPGLAVKPFPKDTFIRVLSGHLCLGTWQSTVAFNSLFLYACIETFAQEPFDQLQRHADDIYMQVLQSSHSQRYFHSSCYWSKEFVQTWHLQWFSNRWCRRTDTCLWTNRSVAKSCLLICVCKVGQSNHSQRILSFELLFWALCVGPDSLAVAFKSWCRGTDTKHTHDQASTWHPHTQAHKQWTTLQNT